ncbi:MAG: porin family protein [candidate division Zixibacteria bacterium]|nr:porin family protein [candidate division Zixibacteria bacterium]
MKSRAVSIWTLLSLVICLGAAAGAAGQDPVDVWDLPPPEKSPLFDPAFYVAAGLDYRAIDHNSLTISPSVVADLLFQFNRAVGVKAGVSYNHYTKLTAGTKIRTFAGHFALRLQLPFETAAPFGETGFQVSRYEASLSHYRLDENNFGIFWTGGLAVRLNDRYSLDFSCKLLWNRFASDNSASLTGDPEWIRPVDGLTTTYHFDRALYNPATLELQIRYRL